MTGQQTRPPDPRIRPVEPVYETVSGGRAVALLVAAVALSVAAALLVANPGSPETSPAPEPAAAAEPVDTDAAAPAASPRTAERIAGDPTAVGEPVGARGPQTIDVELETIEMEGQLADGATYTYWTFDGQVPGPMIRARVGDTVNLTLSNSAESTNIHSIDLHAVTGPGGGATALQVEPGGSKSITFKALNPGVYVYHCASPHIPTHIANGMYGLIVVEPVGGLEPVDREFYVMQGEIYTTADRGTTGLTEYDFDAMTDEDATYVVFNGSANALTGDHAMQAQVGDRVRLFIGNGGPNLSSSFHVIGEIFDAAHPDGAREALHDVQTTTIPAGGATWVEFTIDVPGDYLLVDHAITRTIDKGALAILHAEGPENPDVFVAHDGMAADGHDTSPPAEPEGGTEAGVTEVRMSEFAFTPARLDLRAGEHTFRIINDGAAPHQFAVGAPGEHDAHLIDTGNLASGESTEVTVTLEPGTYEIGCHVPGHYEAGMKATLTVT